MSENSFDALAEGSYSYGIRLASTLLGTEARFTLASTFSTAPTGSKITYHLPYDDFTERPVVSLGDLIHELQFYKRYQREFVRDDARLEYFYQGILGVPIVIVVQTCHRSTARFHLERLGEPNPDGYTCNQLVTELSQGHIAPESFVALFALHVQPWWDQPVTDPALLEAFATIHHPVEA
jgi:hypothetical protein